MALPRIIHRNLIADAAAVVASSSAAGKPVANLGDSLSHTWWGPSAAPASIEIDAGCPVDADGLYIPTHTLDSSLWDVSLYAADLPFSGMQLLAAPEDFSNAAWTKFGATVSVNATAAPDGTTTADKLVATAVGSVYVHQDLSITAGVTYTISVYAKQAEATVLQITGSSGFSVNYQNFDLAAGALGSTDLAGAGSISQTEANGFYRCTFTLTAVATTTGRFLLALVPSASSSRLASYPGDGVKGLYLCGALQNAGATAAPYIPQAAGRWISEAALCYSNRIPKPEQYGAGMYVDAAITLTQNYARAPDGTRTATRVEDTSISAVGYVTLTANVEAHPGEPGSAQALYIQKTVADPNYSLLQLYRASGFKDGVVINTNTGAVTATTGSPSGYGVEDAGDYWFVWVRANANPALGDSVVQAVLWPCFNTNGSAGGNVAAAGSKVVWGAKLEKTLGRPAPYRQDAPLYLPFPSTTKRYWLLRFSRKSGAALPAISVCMIGKALQLPCGLPQGFDPIGRRVNGRQNVNSNGQPLGAVVEFESADIPVTLEHVPWEWARMFLQLWRNGLRSAPFGLAWDYDSHVEDAVLLAASSDLSVPHNSGRVCTVRFSGKGVHT